MQNTFFSLTTKLLSRKVHETAKGKQKGSRGSSLLGVLVLFLSCNVNAAEKSIGADLIARNQKTAVEHWQTTDFSFEWLLRHGLDNTTCRVSTEYFIGCVYALDALLAAAHQGPVASRLVLQSSLHPNKSPRVYDFGDTYVTTKNSTDTNHNRNNYEVWQKYIKSNPNAYLPIAQMISRFAPRIEAAKIPMVVGEMYNQFLKQVYDPHTYVRPKSVFENEFRGNERFIGIGIISVEHSEGIQLRSVLPGGPADRAGLKVFDVITAVDGIKIQGLSVDSVSEKIRGPKNSKLQIEIVRDGRVLLFELKRSTIEIENIQSDEFSVPNNENKFVSYIGVRSFMPQNTCRDFTRQLRAAQNRDRVAGVIVDLRSNGGGDLDIAVCMLSQLLPENSEVITVRDPQTNQIEQTLYTQKPTIQFVKPLVVLVDAASASASEVFAGVVQDHGRGVVMGVRSFGKGTMQAIVPLIGAKNVYLAKTVARFHLPSGRTNQIHGIIPDVVLPEYEAVAGYKTFLREEDAYLNPIPTVPNVPAPTTFSLYTQGCLTQVRAKIPSGQYEPLIEKAIFGASCLNE